MTTACQLKCSSEVKYGSWTQNCTECCMGQSSDSWCEFQAAESGSSVTVTASSHVLINTWALTTLKIGLKNHKWIVCPFSYKCIAFAPELSTKQI